MDEEQKIKARKLKKLKTEAGAPQAPPPPQQRSASTVVSPEEAMKYLSERPAPTKSELKEMVRVYDRKSRAAQKEARLDLVGDKE
jgi:hypothetical protein